ncbi:MAG: PAS domain S-box protein, partial [Burkholderiales bacterium]|nr:PAS domain S-box protein [Opitutaceae bacterium]
PVVSFENRYVRRDGSIVHILWSAWWSEAEQSNFCVAHDNTAAHHAQAALRESEAEFRMLAESMPQIVWMTRPDGWNIYFNQRWMDYTGLTLEESLGHGWNKPFHPDDQQRAWDAWRHATATGGLYSLEVRLRRADGAYQWWLVRGAAQLGPTGEIFKWFGTCTDIDESKRSQGLIAEQAALLDEAHDAIIVRDIEHRVTFWNRGAERLYGWTSAEALGRPVHELIRPTAATFEEALATLRRDGLWNGEIEKTTKAGAVLTLDASWTLLRDAQGQPRSILSIDTNITDRKKLEQQFLRAQRMESIGTLAGGIAHDLNNLLAPITMGVALLKLFAPDPRSLPVIENIERSAKRGADLIKQVLSFARGVEGSRVALQIRHILHEVQSIAQNTFPRNIRVETSFPPELWPVVADPTQLNQVVLNLAVNARDAMPNGGRLELKAENVVIDAQYALMNRGVGAGRYVKIQVTDGGIGIPREIIERIFDPFFTTKELGQGTGLGLSTVLGIVRSHGGFVNVYSELGKGSTFHVYLPAQEEGGPAQADVRIAETLPRGRGELVLVVDDEPPILEITRQTLLAFGYRVVTADDGAHAISVYALQRDKIAVVLTDMMMPVMDGPALIAALRRIDPQVRIIGASGLNANANVTRALGSGVRHFLPKPYSADALLTLLQQVLHGDESRPPR